MDERETGAWTETPIGEYVMELREVLKPLTFTGTLTPHGVDMFRGLLEQIGMEWRQVLGMQGQAKE